MVHAHDVLGPDGRKARAVRGRGHFHAQRRGVRGTCLEPSRLSALNIPRGEQLQMMALTHLVAIAHSSGQCRGRKSSLGKADSRRA